MTIFQTAPITLPTPLGGSLVRRIWRPGQDFDPAELAGLPRLELPAQNVADLEMLATGAYSPLTGFVNEADYLGIVKHLRLADGTPWSLPITLAVSREQAESLSGRVVLTHDVAQRDNLRVGRHDGIQAVIEKLKGNPLFAHVTLTRSERSEIAELVTNLLENG